jgi:excinuclease ABC subunit B
VDKKERVLVTTLTKRTAEELTDYLRDIGINVRYLHSEIDAIERVEILRALRKGEFDVLVGHQSAARRARSAGGFAGGDSRCGQGRLICAATTSLIQTAGRAARHLNGEVILYADVMTHSIQKFLAVSEYRRKANRLQQGTQHHAAQRERAVEESLSTAPNQADSKAVACP